MLSSILFVLAFLVGTLAFLVIVGVFAWQLFNLNRSTTARRQLIEEAESRGRSLLREQRVNETASVGVPLGWGTSVASVWELDGSLILYINSCIIQLHLDDSGVAHPAKELLMGNSMQVSPLDFWSEGPGHLDLHYRRTVSSVRLRFKGSVSELQPLRTALPQALRR